MPALVVMLWLVAVRPEMGVRMCWSAFVAMQIAAKGLVCHRATHPLKASGSGRGCLLNPEDLAPDLAPNASGNRSVERVRRA